MAAPIVAAGIAAIARYMAKKGVNAAVKKYGEKAVREADRAVNKKLKDAPKEKAEGMVRRRQKATMERQNKARADKPKAETKSLEGDDLVSYLRDRFPAYKGKSDAEIKRMMKESNPNAGKTIKNNTLNKGGMTKKAYNKGGYANCGASVAPNGKSKS